MAAIDLDDVAVFVQVVDAGGFTAAARVLQAPKSSVSRRVARLERRLGTRLLQRTTRSIRLTEAGRAFHARVAVALAEVDDAARAAFDAREVPRGTVRVAAPPDVGAEVLPVLLAGFVDRYPEVRVEVEFSADAADLVEQGHDLALRVGRQRDPSLTVVRLQEIAFRLYAAPAYLAGRRALDRPEDLAEHDCVLFRPRAGRDRWRLHGAQGRVDVEVAGRLGGNDIAFVRRAAMAGAGIALLPELVGEQAAATGRLVPVLPGLHADGEPLSLVHPASPHVPLKVRVLRDHLLTAFPQAGAPGRASIDD